MGNAYSDDDNLGYEWGFGLNRSGWKEVSDKAKRDLDEAKQEFHQIVKQYSFQNINDENYKFTKKYAIKVK